MNKSMILKTFFLSAVLIGWFAHFSLHVAAKPIRHHRITKQHANHHLQKGTAANRHFGKYSKVNRALYNLKLKLKSTDLSKTIAKKRNASKQTLSKLDHRITSIKASIQKQILKKDQHLIHMNNATRLKLKSRLARRLNKIKRMRSQKLLPASTDMKRLKADIKNLRSEISSIEKKIEFLQIRLRSTSNLKSAK